MQGDVYVVCSVGDYWAIRNTRTGATKRIGRIGGPRGNMRGINYFDRAKTEAARRMGVSPDEVRIG